MSTAIVVADQRPKQNGLSTQVDFREKIDTIKRTVANGASDSELDMFLTLCNHYQLDPFLKEIWFVKGVGVMTSRDGYLKVAQRNDNYDGIISAAVCKGDLFEMNPVKPEVVHKFGAERGPIIGAYAIVFHKQRRPAVCFASFDEYKKASGVWGTYKSAMICKVAEVLALKRQFGISGLVTEEEIGTPLPPRGQTVTTQPVAPTFDDLQEVDLGPKKPWTNKGEMRKAFSAIVEEMLVRGLGAFCDATLKDYNIHAPDFKFSDSNRALECYSKLAERLDESQAIKDE